MKKLQKDGIVGPGGGGNLGMEGSWLARMSPACGGDSGVYLSSSAVVGSPIEENIHEKWKTWIEVNH